MFRKETVLPKARSLGLSRSSKSGRWDQDSKDNENGNQRMSTQPTEQDVCDRASSKAGRRDQDLGNDRNGNQRMSTSRYQPADIKQKMLNRACHPDPQSNIWNGAAHRKPDVGIKTRNQMGMKIRGCQPNLHSRSSKAGEKEWKCQPAVLDQLGIRSFQS